MGSYLGRCSGQSLAPTKCSAGVSHCYGLSRPASSTFFFFFGSTLNSALTNRIQICQTLGQRPAGVCIGMLPLKGHSFRDGGQLGRGAPEGSWAGLLGELHDTASSFVPSSQRPSLWDSHPGPTMPLEPHSERPMRHPGSCSLASACGTRAPPDP